MKKFMTFACIAIIGLCATSCVNRNSKPDNQSLHSKHNSCTTESDTRKGSDYKHDENYQRSIEREQKLREDGMDNAANIERRARYEYEHGGGYTSPDGGRQIHFQGSKEQAEQLKMMDELGW